MSYSHYCFDVLQQEVVAYQAGLASPDPTWPSDVKRFMRALQQHLFEVDISMEELQEHCGVHDHNFSTRFAMQVGRPPKAYQVYHRLQLAQHLLLHEKLKEISICQIGIAVGYERAQSFATAFKRQTGWQPSRYRLLH